MTIETPAPRTALRPVSGNPDVHHSYADDDWDLETPIDPRVGWSLSYGCKVTFGFDGDVLHVTVSTCDRDQRDGITKRAVTREQVADYARKLLALVGVDGSEVERLSGERNNLSRLLRGMARRVGELRRDRLMLSIGLINRNQVDATCINGLRDELAEAREEITKLKHALDVAEPHEADVRLDVERELRDEAAKAGVR